MPTYPLVDSTMRALSFPALAIATLACSDSTGQVTCADTALELPENVCLEIPSGSVIEAHADLIQMLTIEALSEMDDHLDVNNLRIVLINDAAGAIPEIGIGGFNPSASEIRIFLDTGVENLEQVLRNEYAFQVAHEAHHALRRRTVGYGATLFEAAITEGMADHFALLTAGGSPRPWSTALSGTALESWIDRVQDEGSGPYDHGRWFLGGATDVPRWTGYAVGFELVRVFLESNPDENAATLVDTEASQFLPQQ